MNALSHIENIFNLSLDEVVAVNLDKHDDLPNLFRGLGFTSGAEIGVSMGLFSECLCSRINGLKLYLIDPYTPYHDFDFQSGIKIRTKQEVQDKRYAKAKDRLSMFNCEFIKKPSMEAVKEFEDNSLDFVYIDGNHQYQFVYEDIREWSKKVRPGGIVSGHDYNDRFEVKKAVNDWVKENGIQPLFIPSEFIMAIFEANSNWFYVKT
jgi:SAM-dependent methyltransferase